MKKITFYVLFLLIMLSCNNSPEKKSEKLIKQYMEENLNDFRSYEPVKSGSLDSVFTNVMMTKDWQEHSKKFDEFYELSKETTYEMKRIVDNIRFTPSYAREKEKTRMKNLVSKGTQYSDSMKFHLSKTNILQDEFKKEFKGWSLTHTYRANNALGNKIIEKTLFVFDKELSIITSVQDLD